MSSLLSIITHNENNRKAQETVQMYTLYREYPLLNLRKIE